MRVPFHLTPWGWSFCPQSHVALCSSYLEYSHKRMFHSRSKMNRLQSETAMCQDNVRQAFCCENTEWRTRPVKTVLAYKPILPILSELYINRHMPHPSTSTTHCSDPPVCIRCRRRGFMVSTLGLIYLSDSWVPWLENWTESGALAMSWKLANLVLNPAKDNRSHTDNMIPPLFLCVCPLVLPQMFLFSLSSTSERHSQWDFLAPRTQGMNISPYPPHLFCSRLSYYFPFWMNGDDSLLK